VTGINGFTGPHLARHLLSQGLEVVGVTRSDPVPALQALDGRVDLQWADLLDERRVMEVVQNVEPDFVFHMASVRGVDDLGELLVHNLRSSQHVLRATAQLAKSKETRLLIAGSASEYGMVYSDEQPLDERQPRRPLSPYGLMKMAEVSLALSYFFGEGLAVYVGRSFNLVGPGEPDTLVCSTVVRQAVAMQLGLSDAAIMMGDLSAVRDFVDIRDAAEAYWAIVDKGLPGEVYNVCSGSGTSIQSVVDHVIELTGVAAPVKIDPDKLRPVAIPGCVGDGRKIRRQTGWKAATPVRQSLADLIEHWRERLMSERQGAAALRRPVLS
jgi:GDP-4-dehydro-6-deoxy-D-mannose reductase